MGKLQCQHYCQICIFLSLFSSIISEKAGKDSELVTFEYYSKDIPSVVAGRGVTCNDGLQTLIYIHGWRGDMRESREMKDAIFKKRKDVCRVILVDWETLSHAKRWHDVIGYWAAENHVPKIAAQVLNELEWLHGGGKFNPKETEIVAHSLGVLIEGQVVKSWNKNHKEKIGALVALDPPNLGFYFDIKKTMKLLPRSGDTDYVKTINADTLLSLRFNLGDENIHLTQEEINAVRICANKDLWNFDRTRCEHSAPRDYFKEDPIPRRTQNPSTTTQSPAPSTPRVVPLKVTMLVLDVSPSMHENGKMRLKAMVASATNFVESAPIGSFMGIVVFGGRASSSQSPVNISDQSVRKSVVAKLPNLNSQLWGTSIGAGLSLARDQVRSFTDAGHCPNIILLTDGEENTRPFIRDVNMSGFCAKVNSVALGRDADVQLENVSSQTGGKTFAVGDLNNLAATRQELTSALSSAGDDEKAIILPTKRGKVGSEPTMFTIDPAVGKNTRFLITTPKFAKVDVKLRAPDRKVHDSSSSHFKRNELMEGLEFNFPDATSGKWSVDLLHLGNSRRKRSLEEFASISVTTFERSEEVSPVRIFAALNSSILTYGGDGVVLLVGIRKGNDSILQVKVTAKVTSPSGQAWTKTLLDNGLGADEIELDGTYSGFISLPNGKSNDRFTVQVVAVNKNEARIRPVEDDAFYGSQAAIEQAAIEKYKKADEFERQLNVGSIRAEGKYKRGPPARVTDLEVVGVNAEERTLALVWTASGDEWDNGTASGVQIRATANRRIPESERFEFNGTVLSLPAGELQRIILDIPQDLWENGEIVGGGVQLYFTLRTVSSEGLLGDVSNVAPSNYGIYGQVEEGGFMGLWIGIGVVVLIFLGFVYGRLYWRKF